MVGLAKVVGQFHEGMKAGEDRRANQAREGQALELQQMQMKSLQQGFDQREKLNPLQVRGAEAGLQQGAQTFTHNEAMNPISQEAAQAGLEMTQGQLTDYQNGAEGRKVSQEYQDFIAKNTLEMAKSLKGLANGTATIEAQNNYDKAERTLMTSAIDKAEAGLGYESATAINANPDNGVTDAVTSEIYQGEDGVKRIKWTRGDGSTVESIEKDNQGNETRVQLDLPLDNLKRVFGGTEANGTWKWNSDAGEYYNEDTLERQHVGSSGLKGGPEASKLRADNKKQAFALVGKAFQADIGNWGSEENRAKYLLATTLVERAIETGLAGNNWGAIVRKAVAAAKGSNSKEDVKKQLEDIQHSWYGKGHDFYGLGNKDQSENAKEGYAAETEDLMKAFTRLDQETPTLNEQAGLQPSASDQAGLTSSQPAAGLEGYLMPSGQPISEKDIQDTMSSRGLSREQVVQKIRENRTAQVRN